MGIQSNAFIKAGLWLVGLMVLAMLFTATLSSPEEVQSMNLIGSLMWYRIAAFSLLVAGWNLVCRYITRKPPIEHTFSKEELDLAVSKRELDYQYLVTLRWKVALLCIFFELVVIQQFGMA